MIDQFAEAARWLHVDKGMSLEAVAEKLQAPYTRVRNAVRQAEGLKATARPSEARQQGIVEVAQSREPCTYCGVRADYGCKHNRRAA